MDNEKPDLEEVYEQVSEIHFVFEFYLEDGALDGFSTVYEAKQEISKQMKNLFFHLNPFDSPEMETSVNFYDIEVCENEKTHEVDETGNACEPSALQNGGLLLGQWIGRKTKKTVARVHNTFKGWGNYGGPWGETVQWTSKKTQKLEKNLVKIAVNLSTPEAESCTESVGEGDDLLSKMILKEPFLGAVLPIFSDSFSFQLHKWMAHLSPRLRKIPFTMLAIPGTHNSATHTMHRDQSLSYDSPLYADNEANPYLSFMTPETLESWGKCVKHDINQQLEIGIRYFDFRLKLLFIFTFYILF